MSSTSLRQARHPISRYRGHKWDQISMEQRNRRTNIWMYHLSTKRTDKHYDLRVISLTLLYSYEYDNSRYNYMCCASHRYQEVAVSNQQIQKVKVKRLAHIGLWATDVPTQARFYHQVLGLDLRTASDNPSDLDLDEANLFFALDDEAYYLGLFHDNRPPMPNGRKPVIRTPLHHLAFT